MINRIKPSFIRLDVTDKCNLSCWGCYRSERKKNDLSMDKIFQIIDKIKKFGVDTIIFGGGEPFFRNDLKEIIFYAEKKNINCYIVSNGTLIKKSDLGFLKKYSPNLSISLDGYNEKTNGKSRTPFSFEGVIKNLYLLKNKNIKFNLVTTLSKMNIQYLEKIISFGKKLGVKEHHFVRFIPIGRGSVYRNWYLSDNEWYKVIERLKRDKKLLFDEKCLTGDCGAGKEFLYILVNRDITICTRKSEKEMILGNIFSDSIEEIWRHSILLKKIKSLKKVDCLNCNLIKNQ